MSSCLPFEVKFTNTSQFYNSSVWDFGPGEGSSTLNNPVHYYSQPGVYPVKLIVRNPGGCIDSIIKNITVFDTLGSRVNYIPISGCKPLDVNFNTFSPGTMASYFWDFGDGTTMSSTTPNISHVYNSFGTFVPSVIMEDPTGCLIPLQGLDTVLVSGATANFGTDQHIYCDRATVAFTDSTTFNDPVASYSWTFGDGGTSSDQHPVHTYNSPGLYTVTLAVETMLGCRDTLTKSAMIAIVQRPLIDIAGDTSVCMNDEILHLGTFIQPDTSVVTWLWQFPNGNSSAQQNPPPQIYSVPGTYTVTSIATNSTGCRDTTTQVIVVHPLPAITIPGQMTIQTGFPVTIPATYSPNTISWIWSPATGLSCTDCPTPVAGPNFNTTYQVYFTDENGCSNIGEVEVIVICKNANLFMPNTFSPNGDGSNDIFYPRGHGLERVRHLRIFNRWGEVVFEKRDFPVNDAAFGWNGTYKGKKAQADVYVYQVEVFCDNGEILRINGNIALIL
jgi:gliding motility-associated-like protein